MHLHMYVCKAYRLDVLDIFSVIVGDEPPTAMIRNHCNFLCGSCTTYM